MAHCLFFLKFPFITTTSVSVLNVVIVVWCCFICHLPHGDNVEGVVVVLCVEFWVRFFFLCSIPSLIEHWNCFIKSSLFDDVWFLFLWCYCHSVSPLLPPTSLHYTMIMLKAKAIIIGDFIFCLLFILAAWTIRRSLFNFFFFIYRPFHCALDTVCWLLLCVCVALCSNLIYLIIRLFIALLRTVFFWDF